MGIAADNIDCERVSQLARIGPSGCAEVEVGGEKKKQRDVKKPIRQVLRKRDGKLGLDVGGEGENMQDDF